MKVAVILSEAKDLCSFLCFDKQLRTTAEILRFAQNDKRRLRITSEGLRMTGLAFDTASPLHDLGVLWNYPLEFWEPVLCCRKRC